MQWNLRYMLKEISNNNISLFKDTENVLLIKKSNILDETQQEIF